MKKIAIVTPELVGLYKNGGIGTDYFFRARFLRGSLNYQVTILYTGACSASQAEAWREQHGQTGIRLEILPEIPTGTPWEMFTRRAAAVHQWLTSETWDEIHFAEYLANGFRCLQAKRAGLAYQNTRLVVTMHSSSRWCREGMQWDLLDPETDTKLDYAERYSCENADTVISPSHYMVQWVKRKGWRLPADTTVLPNLYEKLEHEDSPASQPNLQHLIFFGRLQTLKGLEIFCEAVTRLVQAGHAPARVDFLGKVGSIENQPADQYIRQMSAQWPATEVQIHTDLDCFAAMHHIRRTGGLAVIASLRDNLPYTVIECIINQAPFIASNACGIPELADPRVLFAPDARSLAAKLKEFARLPPQTKFNHPYRIETTRAAWEKFAATPFVVAAPPAVAPPAPKLSVCVPFYNHGKYLPTVLAALARQTYGNFEVIVVDDGSTAADAQETFEMMRQKYAGPQFRFFRQENAGVGAARNFAASHASGEYLVFVDADNLPLPQMLAVFAQAMQFSAADCATCHMAMFHHEAELEKPPRQTHAPLGPCLEGGWRINLFGDANFIVTKKVFTQLGGFATDRNAVEDWQFLVRLALRGFNQIVVPEILFWYRFLPDSMMRQADESRVTRTILETYREGLAFWPASILENYVFQPYQSNVGGHTIATRQATLVSRKPAGERRRRAKFMQKLQRSSVKRLLEFADFISRL
jgi:glycosyltransferase involved in cell wall biosynthesis